jgi:hypothetical protein
LCNSYSGTQPEHEPSIRPSPYRAPTWSWLSIDGEIKAKPPSTYSRPLIEILEAKVTPEVENEKGGIKERYIHISGYVKSNIAILHNPNWDEWIWDEPPVRAMYVPIYSNEGR